MLNTSAYKTKKTPIGIGQYVDPLTLPERLKRFLYNHNTTETVLLPRQLNNPAKMEVDDSQKYKGTLNGLENPKDEHFEIAVGDVLFRTCRIIAKNRDADTGLIGFEIETMQDSRVTADLGMIVLDGFNLQRDCNSATDAGKENMKALMKVIAENFPIEGIASTCFSLKNFVSASVTVSRTGLVTTFRVEGPKKSKDVNPPQTDEFRPRCPVYAHITSDKLRDAAGGNRQKIGVTTRSEVDTEAADYHDAKHARLNGPLCLGSAADWEREKYVYLWMP